MITLLTAGALSLAFTLLLTPLFIRLFTWLGWGQFIRDDGPQSHHVKRGTPTMGGIIFIIGAIFGYFLAHLFWGETFTLSGVLVLFLMVGLGAVGFVDDFIKTRRQRSLGLGGWAKIAGMVVVAGGFAALALNFPDAHGLTPASTMISFVRDIGWLNLAIFGTVVGGILFAIWVTLIIVSAGNAVNVADGLDGLASGAAIFSLSAYILIGFWQFNQWCFPIDPNAPEPDLSRCYEVRDPLDLAIVAAAIVGALIGFLWWNTHPAQIIMGDTGSLGIGGALAALAILSRTELLLVFIGGLFLIVTGSVIVQTTWFKFTRRRYGQGRRIFLMSPLHHHFELKGWAEITVVVRFWLIAALFVAVGVGLFYLEWIYR